MSSIPAPIRLALVLAFALVLAPAAWAQTITDTQAQGANTVITLEADLGDSITIATGGRGTSGPFTSVSANTGLVDFAAVNITQPDDTDGSGDSRLRYVHADNSITAVAQLEMEVLFSGFDTVNVDITGPTPSTAGATGHWACVATGSGITWENGSNGFVGNNSLVPAPPSAGSLCHTFTTPGAPAFRDFDLALHLANTADSTTHQAVFTITATGSP